MRFIDNLIRYRQQSNAAWKNVADARGYWNVNDASLFFPFRVTLGTLKEILNKKNGFPFPFVSLQSIWTNILRLSSSPPFFSWKKRKDFQLFNFWRSFWGSFAEQYVSLPSEHETWINTATVSHLRGGRCSRRNRHPSVWRHQLDQLISGNYAGSLCWRTLAIASTHSTRELPIKEIYLNKLSR